MPDVRVLPELVRSLRLLGAPRDVCDEAAHAAIFLPLLEARARATGASLDVTLAALRGDALSARIEANVVDAAVNREERPAHVRALTAQATELMAPLRAQLLLLDELSGAATRDSDVAWSAWVAQLRRVFVSADTMCRGLTELLSERGEPEAATGWSPRVPR